MADGLVDTAVAAGQAGTHTYPSSAPRTRIDAVFTDPRCAVIEYRVIDTAQARSASDHLPVVVDLALQHRRLPS